MAVSGFEGFEKRLELNFFCNNPSADNELGLRLLDFESLEKVLDLVQCTVVAAVANRHFDAYVLSESSLFIYPTKIIIKTCGTTQLLKSIRPLIRHARNLGLTLRGCRYTRGCFIFPETQPFPHTSFKEEVVYIEENLPRTLCYRKASVIPSRLPSHVWHVFAAGSDAVPICQNPSAVVFEVCMTDLDRVLARNFFKSKGESEMAGKSMTSLSGIDLINPNATICDFAFDPCGYSMNGIEGNRYSTIHVTPEDGFSYASFECCVGSVYSDEEEDVAMVLKRAVEVFGPGKVSIAATYGAGKCLDVSKRVERVLGRELGLKCRSRAIDEFPGCGNIVYQTFTPRRK